MGCIISREVASRNLADSEEKKEKSSECGEDLERKEADVAVVEVAQEEGHGHGGQPLTKEQRRKLKSNPRLSNLPKQSQAEQVAAGWPSWLTAVCGEALNGWIPRKADTFEKPATAISQPADEEVARHTTTCSCRIVNGDRRNQNAIRIQRTTCNLQQMIHDEGMACSREMAYGDSQLGCATRTEEQCSGDRTKRKDQTLAESWILDGMASQI